MNTNLSNLSELAKILGAKSEIRANILVLFSRYRYKTSVLQHVAGEASSHIDCVADTVLVYVQS